MNSISPAPTPRRRRIWLWLAVIAAVMISPFLILGAMAVSYLTLDGDARVLRREVMAATDSKWSTRVQLSVGGVTLGAIRTGLEFAHGKDIQEARQALAAVKNASVGVYERKRSGATCSNDQLFVQADRAMNRRGWARLVGVTDPKNTVLVYVSEDSEFGKTIDVCVAVVSDKEMVVTSATVDAEALLEFAEQKAGKDWKHGLKLAKL